MRRAAASVLLLAASCGGGKEVALGEMRERLLAATPETERAAVAYELDALADLARDGKIGDVERRALLDLYRSASRDGVDEDERLLLVQFARELVAGSTKEKT